MTLRNPQIKGRCPACHNATLFLGDGGHITCSWIECPNPGAAGQVLDGVQGVDNVAQFLENLEAIIRAFQPRRGQQPPIRTRGQS